MPPWLLVDTQPDTLDTGVTRDTPVTGVTRNTRIPMGTGKENDAPGPVVGKGLGQASTAVICPNIKPRKAAVSKEEFFCWIQGSKPRLFDPLAGS